MPRGPEVLLAREIQHRNQRSEAPLAHVQIFLSSVSAEFRSYRDLLREDLDRPNVTVKVQEDFIATGTPTLDKLDEYIQQCDVVVHLVGDMTGALAQGPSVELIRQRYPDFSSRLPVLRPFLEPNGPALPYTQWEAWLALYHGRALIIATPEFGAPRDPQYQLVDDQRKAQQAHLAHLAEVEKYPEILFSNADRLAVGLLRSKILDILVERGIETEWNVRGRLQPELRQFSDLASLGRVRGMASSLLEVGRQSWKMPRFIAPLNLDAQEEEADSEPHPTSIVALTETVGAGGNLVLFGEGGIVSLST